MHAVIRTYSGGGSNRLFDLLEERKPEVDALMRSIDGFVSYLLVRTGDGGSSVTVCRDKAGVDESARRAKQWIAANALSLHAPAPTVSEGPVIAQFSAEASAVAAAMPLPADW